MLLQPCSILQGLFDGEEGKSETKSSNGESAPAKDDGDGRQKGEDATGLQGTQKDEEAIQHGRTKPT